MPQVQLCCAKQTDFALDQTVTNLATPLPCPVEPDTVVLPTSTVDLTRFGNSTVFSADGLTMVIGAPSYSPVTPDAAIGAVFIYRKRKLPTRPCSGDSDTNKFVLQQVLFNPVLTDGALFGAQVAISADGRRILVGTPNELINSLSLAGAVYVFDLLGCTKCFIPTQQLIAQIYDQDGNVNPDTAQDAVFGSSLALSGDGNVAFVGSRLYPTGTSVPFTEKVYVYAVGPIDVCSRQQRALEFAQVIEFDKDESLALSKQDLSAFYFGYSLSLSYDGRVAMIGAPLTQINVPVVNPVDNGAAFVYKRVNCKQEWLLTQVLLDKPDGFTAAQVGSDVFVSPDGKQLFSFSALTLSPTIAPFTALYQRLVTGQFKLVEFVVPSATQTTSQLDPIFRPSYIAVSDSGCVLAVSYSGTQVSGEAAAGEIIVYKRCSTRALFENGVEQTLTEATPDENNRFGVGIAIDGKGLTLAAAAGQLSYELVFESEIVFC